MKSLLLDEGILQQLVPLLEDGGEAGPGKGLDALASAVRSVCELTACEEFVSHVFHPRLLRCLIKVLDNRRLPVATREDAARALKNVALDDSVREMLAEKGAIQALPPAAPKRSTFHAHPHLARRRQKTFFPLNKKRVFVELTINPSLTLVPPPRSKRSRP